MTIYLCNWSMKTDRFHLLHEKATENRSLTDMMIWVTSKPVFVQAAVEGTVVLWPHVSFPPNSTPTHTFSLPSYVQSGKLGKNRCSFKPSVNKLNRSGYYVQSSHFTHVHGHVTTHISLRVALRTNNLVWESIWLPFSVWFVFRWINWTFPTMQETKDTQWN